MSTFANRMQEAKRAKAEARSVGQGQGDYRGTVQPRRLEDAPTDWLEMAFARIALGLAHDNQERQAQLDWYILENSDPTIAEYAAAQAIPY
jgi:hypothetical protein